MDVSVFKPPDIHQPSHMVSNILYWRNQYKLLASASFEHNRAIGKAFENNEKYLAKLRRKAPGKEERRYCREMRLYQDILRHQMDKLRNDGSEYLDLEKSLKGFTDDPALQLSKLDNYYKLARDKLESQTKVVEDIKKDYHKSMFAMEKVKIKAMLATSKDVVLGTRARLQELDNKVVAQLNTYNNQLDTWQAKFDKLHKIAMQMERSFLAREEARSSKVLSLLQKSVEMTNTGMHAKRDPAFTSINGRSIILEKIQTVDYTVPLFEEYIKQDDTSELYTKARAEIDQEEGRQTTINLSELTGQNGPQQIDPATENIRQRFAANKKLKQLRNVKLHLVTKAYEKHGVNQLSLKVGEYVKQLLPENEDGLAFGEVVHGLLHKKKKGFYPVSHVTAVWKEVGERNLNENEDDRDQTQSESAEMRDRRHATRPTAHDDSSFDDMVAEKRNKKKHRRNNVSNVADAETDIKVLSQTRPEQKNKDARNKTQEANIEKEPKKKQKTSMFSVIAQRLRGNAGKEIRNESAIETEKLACSPVDTESETSFTEVQGFVFESDSEDEDEVLRMRRSQPRIAFQEEQDTAEQSTDLPHRAARSRRREKLYKHQS